MIIETLRRHKDKEKFSNKTLNNNSYKTQNSHWYIMGIFKSGHQTT